MNGSHLRTEGEVKKGLSAMNNVKSWIKWGVGAMCALSLMGANAAAAGHMGLRREVGTLKSIDVDHTAITVTDPHTHSILGFVWDHQTRFLDRGKTVTAKDLTPGERVLVRYRREDQGNVLLAKVIRVLPAHAATHGHSAVQKS